MESDQAEKTAEEAPESNVKDPVPPDSAEGKSKDKDEKEKAPAKDKKGLAASSDIVPFNDDIDILPNQRLPQYDKGPVKAYAARGRGKVAGSLFVLICEDHLVPRSSVTPKYVSVINPNLVALVASGSVFWPAAKKEKYCFIYQNILGDPIMKDDTHGGLGWNHDLVMSAVVKPMIGVLMDMRDKDIVHGEIHPANMFNGGAKNIDKVILGECLANPVSSQLPALYEPVERAMAHPTAKGLGTHEDDLYSFGVSLAVILRTNDPLEGMSEEQVINKKIEDGSYQALTGKDRFTGAILELLRGLLYDDRGQRWTLDEVQAWMDGRRLSPKQSAKKAKGSRPIIFNEKKYLRPEVLAKDLQKNVTEAVQIIENDEMDQWLKRAVEDKIIQKRYEQSVELMMNSARGGDFMEQMATTVAMALHPDAPIHYKGFSFMPDGMSKALIEAYVLKKDTEIFTDIIEKNFALTWVDMQTNTPVDSSAIISKFDTCRAFLRQSANIGFGFERCLYFLAPECHCLSEIVADYYVRTPEDLMHAYEKIATSPKRPVMFFDRHIHAFLSVKDRKNIDPYFPELGSADRYRRVLGELKALATIQKRSRMENFPGIAEWICDNLDCVYERIHDRQTRKEIKKKIDKAKDKGDLSKIAVIFDDPNLYNTDYHEFKKAMREFYDLDKESLKLEREMEDKKTFGRETGHQAAAVVSAVLACVIMLASGFFALGQ